MNEIIGSVDEFDLRYFYVIKKKRSFFSIEVLINCK